MNKFQYNVPAPSANECCNVPGAWRWEFIAPAAEYQDALALSRNVDAAVLIFCGWWWGLWGPCESQTAGDCGELHAIGSLELGLCSGGSSPFFMIFFSFDLLFWNQIFTWGNKNKNFFLSFWGQINKARVSAKPLGLHHNNIFFCYIVNHFYNLWKKKCLC